MRSGTSEGCFKHSMCGALLFPASLASLGIEGAIHFQSCAHSYLAVFPRQKACLPNHVLAAQ